MSSSLDIDYASFKSAFSDAFACTTGVGGEVDAVSREALVQFRAHAAVGTLRLRSGAVTLRPLHRDRYTPRPQTLLPEIATVTPRDGDRYKRTRGTVRPSSLY